MNLTPILQSIRKEIKQLRKAELVVASLGRKAIHKPTERHITAAARHRISLAQKARWAKWKKQNGPKLVRKAA